MTPQRFVSRPGRSDSVRRLSPFAAPDLRRRTGVAGLSSQQEPGRPTAIRRRAGRASGWRVPATRADCAAVSAPWPTCSHPRSCSRITSRCSGRGDPDRGWATHSLLVRRGWRGGPVKVGTAGSARCQPASRGVRVGMRRSRAAGDRRHCPDRGFGAGVDAGRLSRQRPADPHPASRRLHDVHVGNRAEAGRHTRWRFRAISMTANGARSLTDHRRLLCRHHGNRRRR